MRYLSVAALATTLVACQPSEQSESAKTSTHTDQSPSPHPELCESPATPIAEIQGQGFISPLENQEVTARGVVTHVVPGSGLFIQAERTPDFGITSHGLYVESTRLPADLESGELLTVQGTIRELGEHQDTITSISLIERYAACGPVAEPPEIGARLPLSPEQREAFEAMRVVLVQPLTVTAVRDVNEGQITLSALGLLRAPTEVALPGTAALDHQRDNTSWSLTIENDALSNLEPYTSIHAGAQVREVSGILGHDGKQFTLLSENQLDHESQPLPAFEPASEEEIRIVSYNLYEYFNGDGRNSGFPGERGAETLEEFESQSARIISAIEQLKPDVLGVMELENDGFEPDSAIEHLRRSISEAIGSEFAVATPRSEQVGTDVINVGLLYRQDRLEAVGPARLLESGNFGPLNRVPIAQVLRDRASDERFVVVVNHLKSKGWCPDSGNNTDQGDGQACWNEARVEGATETVNWARAIAKSANTDHYLLIGDFNAYRMEDPVRAIETAGLIELAAYHNPNEPQFSYIFRGAAGTLDYAFGSESLAAKSTRGFIWNINSIYPYSSRPSKPWLRSSDHDPVVVDLLFTQSATPD